MLQNLYTRLMVQSLINRIWDSLLRLLLQRITLVLTLMLCGAIAIAIYNMSALSSSLIESQALQNAALNIQSLTQAFDLYSAAAAEQFSFQSRLSKKLGQASELLDKSKFSRKV